MSRELHIQNGEIVNLEELMMGVEQVEADHEPLLTRVCTASLFGQEVKLVEHISPIQRSINIYRREDFNQVSSPRDIVNIY